VNRQTQLTDRFFAFAGLIVFIGVLAFVLNGALLIYAALMIALISLAVVDFKSLTDTRSFQAGMHFPPSPELEQNLELECSFVIQDAKVGRLSKVEVYAPAVQALRFDTPTVALSRAEFSAKAFKVKIPAQVVQLGFTVISDCELAIESTLGFWRRRLRLAIRPPVEFRVSPQNRDISEQTFVEMISAQRFLFAGARLRAKSRSPDQYLTTRPYRYPDSIRLIDQKKSAKASQLMTRVFDADFSHHFILALDSGRAMCGQFEGNSKHDYFLSASLLVARNAIQSQDRVSFFAFSDRLHHLVRQARNLRSFDSLQRGDQILTPIEVETDYHQINHTVGQISGQRSVVIVLTDLSRSSVHEALLSALGPLCRKHLVVVLSLLDQSLQPEAQVLEFRQVQQAVSLEMFQERYANLIYSYWNSEQFEIFRKRFAQHGGAALQVTHDNWMGAVHRLYELLRQSSRA